MFPLLPNTHKNLRRRNWLKKGVKLQYFSVLTKNDNLTKIDGSQRHTLNLFLSYVVGVDDVNIG